MHNCMHVKKILLISQNVQKCVIFKYFGIDIFDGRDILEQD